ncbi:hypothetical protein ACFLZG_05550 [Thermodesulfobacteriota bacterium]
MKEIILAFCLGVCFGGIVSWLRFRYVWTNQKKIEHKFKTLDEATKALALFEREALDPEIQNKKRVYDKDEQKTSVRSIELSAGTDILIRTALAKTKALYPERTYQCLDSTFKTQLDVNDPNGDRYDEFVKKSEKAIEEMSKDIQANMSNWFSTMTWQLHKDRSKLMDQGDILK